MIAHRLSRLGPGLGLALALAACTPEGAPQDQAKPEVKDPAKPESKDGADKTAAKPETKEATPLPPKPEAPPQPTTPPQPTFRKGQIGPKGMPVETLLAYNKAQGDPTEGEFTLEAAFEGAPELADAQSGKLFATFETTMGNFRCELFADKVPKTVANFVGLARGTRPFYDKKTDTWIKEPFFDGVLFHRVIKNFMIQTGDRLGTGTGNPGYLVMDEIDPGLKHNKAGILSMANRGPNTGSSQFFVTVAATPHLDGKHAVFGQCDPKVPVKISEVKVRSGMGMDSRPLDDIKITSIKFERAKK
ncbi:MAG: peptidylprolyl isomerase [Nannocystaceae bacterium]